MRRKMAAGNWKMNGIQDAQLDDAGNALEPCAHADAKICDILICPPGHIDRTAAASLAPKTGRSSTSVRTELSQPRPRKAHITGDISAADVRRCTVATYVIARVIPNAAKDHNESRCAGIRAKTTAAVWAAGLTAILCASEKVCRTSAKPKQRSARHSQTQLAASVPDDATPGKTLVMSPMNRSGPSAPA